MSQQLGPCTNFVEGISVAVGYHAGQVHSTGTGGIYLGYQAGTANSSGPMSIAIGANASTGTTGGSSIVIGASASATHGSATSGCIAIGALASCTSLNSCVIGNSVIGSTFGPKFSEFGRAHQFYWKVATYNASATLSGTTGAAAMCGGWIAFEDITANRTLTLPNMTDILQYFPNVIEGTYGELIISNFNDSGYTITVNNGTNAYLYNTNTIPANTIQHVYYRYIDTSGFVQPTPYVEFFS